MFLFSEGRVDFNHSLIEIKDLILLSLLLLLFFGLFDKIR